MNKKKWIIIISSAFVLLLLGASAGFCYYTVNSFANSNVIASNIVFNDTYIGDLTVEEATDLLGRAENSPVNKQIKVVHQDKSFEFSPSGSGIGYDYHKICEEAYKIGRSDSFFKNLTDIWDSRFSYRELEPQYSVDMDNFNGTVKTLSEASGITFNNFDIKVYENYADVKISDNIQEIDYEALYNTTMDIVKGMNNSNEISLPVKNIDVVNADMIYELIYVEPKNASSEEIDGKTIVTSHTIGVILEKDDIKKELDEGKKNFRVKITKKYPEVRVENLSGGLFSDVLGSYTSKYNSGIAGRTRNVTLAAQKINGVILNSGDVFSYNKTVGPRTATAGFSVATIYTKDGLEEELGGGICQVTSTLYNATLYADLKIVERRNHSYTVSYVKNGLDATVAYGAIDFRFQNNRNTPVKIVTSASGGVLTVTILGKKDNNNKIELYTNTLESYPFETKEIENPELQPGEKKVVQNGSAGYKITAAKVVKDSQGNILRNESLGTSVYKPLTKIVEVGPVLTESVSPEGEEVNSSGTGTENGDVSVPPEQSEETDKQEENKPSEEASESDNSEDEHNEGSVKPGEDTLAVPETKPEEVIPDNNGETVAE